MALRRMTSAVMAAAMALAVVALLVKPVPSRAGMVGPAYQVLPPIRQGNLTIFPVVANTQHNSGDFLTLDQGLASGEVLVTEAGRLGLVRRHGNGTYYPIPRGDQVNQLVLVNNSKRALLLLAGEVVTGGKQDRIVGKDLIIPAESESDLAVFCVEPGRWTQTSANFHSTGGYGGGVYMAQPSIRRQAMDKKSQQGVWDQVNAAKTALPAAAPTGSRVAAELAGVSSYARVMENKEIQQQVDAIAMPVEHSYDRLMRELRARNAVGVVAAINGRLVWADIFSSSALLEKYWPKLVRSYAAEALESGGPRGNAGVAAAQDFLAALSGEHETTDTTPGVFRYSEITGEGFKVFELTSLLPQAYYDVHISKMAD